MVWRGLGVIVGAVMVMGGLPSRAATVACLATEAALQQMPWSSAERALVVQTKVSNGQVMLKPFLNIETLRQDFPNAGPDDRPSGWFMSGQGNDPVSVKPPSREMAKAFIDGTRVSATTCPNVLNYALRSGIALERSAKRRPRRTSGRRFSRTVVELTKAIVSPDGTEALVYMSSISGPLAGGGHLLLFRREGSGAWRFSGQLGVWVS